MADNSELMRMPHSGMTADEAADFINRRTPVTAEAGEVTLPAWYAVDYTGCIYSFGSADDAVKAAQQFAETANGGKPVVTRASLLEAGEASDAEINAKLAEIRHQLKCNVEIIEQGYPQPKPALLPHAIRILTGHVEDRLTELERLIAARRVQPKQDAPIPDVAGLIEALTTIQDYVECEFAEGEKAYQVAIVARQALSHLTSPKQDDARDSTVGAKPVAASTSPAHEGYEWTPDRDDLGRKVRAAWVAWAETQPNPKASWLVPYDELSEADKEADRQIGEALTAELAELAEGLEKWGDEQSARADAAETALASARADGVREGLERAAQWHDDSGFTGQQHDVAAAAIRALINKDAGGPDAH